MATARYWWYGVQIDLSDSETTQLASAIATGSSAVAVIQVTLAGFGLNSASAFVVSQIVAAVIRLGGNALASCNSHRKGIQITILWVGLPWCKSL